MIHQLQLSHSWAETKVWPQKNPPEGLVEGRTFAQSMLSQDAHIWLSIQKEDQAAMQKVFEENYASLCRFAVQWTADFDEAEEIVQKMFVDLWEKRNEIQIEITIRSYLFGAVRNSCLNFLKHKKVMASHQLYVKTTTSEAEQLEDLSGVNDALHRAIEALPEQCARVFRMVKMEGMRYAEIAEHLQISTKTIENHMTKALRILRHELRDYLSICIWLVFLLSNEPMN